MLINDHHVDGKRKLWTDGSCNLTDNLTIREASRLYNVLFETLRRCANGNVVPGCKAGPAIVLMEDQLSLCLKEMAKMGLVLVGNGHVPCL